MTLRYRAEDLEIWLEVVDWRFLKARGVPSQQDDTTSRRANAGGKKTPRYAKTMLAEALEAEVREYLEAARGERDEHGRALVVRNGHARERQVILGAGAVEVKAPRVNDRR